MYALYISNFCSLLPIHTFGTDVINHKNVNTDCSKLKIFIAIGVEDSSTDDFEFQFC